MSFLFRKSWVKFVGKLNVSSFSLFIMIGLNTFTVIIYCTFPLNSLKKLCVGNGACTFLILCFVIHIHVLRCTLTTKQKHATYTVFFFLNCESRLLRIYLPRPSTRSALFAIYDARFLSFSCKLHFFESIIKY